MDQNRDNIKSKFPEFDQFEKNFEVTADMINDIVARGEKKEIEKNEESLAFAENNMKKEIKAIIARDIYSRNDFYKIYYKDDEAILKALEVIENQKEYDNLLVTTE